MTLMARENQGTLNEKEFDLSFVPYDWPGSGRLRFKFSFDMNSEFTIYSDTNFWEVGEWHHVALTLDYSEGMMMFIDGYQQLDFYPLYEAIPYLSKMTAIGRWGEIDDRYFIGRIDDVRLSYSSIYISDFTPPCPDIALTENTAALYHFNEGAGFTAWDSGPNGFDGLINGPVYFMDSICTNVGIDYIKESELIIFPHPIYSSSKIKLPNFQSGKIDINIYDCYGKLVRTSHYNSTDEILISKDNLHAGIYLLELYYNDQYLSRTKVIVL
jgi:hypothetical protein